MATTERRIDAADRAIARQLAALGSDLRAGRLAADHSLKHVARLVGRSRQYIAKVEGGRAPDVTARDLARLGALTGHDLSLRLFPAGPPLRDRAHLDLLERLRSVLARGLNWRVEVPLPGLRDRRAFDAVILGAGDPIAIEAETVLHDLQALEREIALKCRDAGVGRVILLVRRSARNREVLRSADPSFWSAYPVPATRTLAALREGRDPRGSSVIVR